MKQLLAKEECLIGCHIFYLQIPGASLLDMYIDTTEPSENVGQIHFCIEYDFQNSTLILKILQVSTF